MSKKMEWRLFRLVFIIVLSCICLSKNAVAQITVEFSPKLQKAYFEIQKLRLNPARQLVESEKSSPEINAFIPYLDSYGDLHYLLISEDIAAYKQFTEQEGKRLEIIGKLPDNSPYKRFLQAEIRLHNAFAKLKFGSEVGGSWEIIKAYKLLEENHRKFPDFLPTLKSLGLLHVLIGSIPENYSWVARILGLKGNIKEGIAEIRLVEKEEPFFRQEAELVDLLLHAYTLQLSAAQLARLKQWPKEQRDNLLLHFFATTVWMKEGKSEEAAEFLMDVPTGNSYIAFPFLNYLRAEIHLQKGNYASAIRDYQLFLSQYKGFNYIKDSNFKIFMCFWLLDKSAEANAYISKIKTSGKTIIEADQFAERIAQEFSAGKIGAQQKILYRARYATDGGFLTEAYKLIETSTETNFPSESEKAEFNYRKARILQKLEKNSQATPYFQRSIQLAQNISPGFAALSALQLGYVYLSKKDLAKAAAYFKQAISYKKHEYKNSVDNKARAALTQMEK
ncbi:tetratricopeptide repeat protein [Dyadobacter sp. CY323]|uniref:tetratricopeptide repeat protein n=1 Tax=Dyadobacter sp. CY323 TaxID=2907302 RepID=UPI001F3A3A99|nr:tetratricopeptide repeat protein [Dyadobacter sp. CY323]MCE6991710.1 tetratricopeptide repeat protein [Dyadobacter sp. CY323]